MEKPPFMDHVPKEVARNHGFSMANNSCEESLHGELGTRGYVAPEAGKPNSLGCGSVIVHQSMANGEDEPSLVGGLDDFLHFHIFRRILPLSNFIFSGRWLNHQFQ